MTSRVYPTTSGMRHLVLIDVLSLTLHAAKYNVFIMVCTAKASIQMRIAWWAEKITTILTAVHTKCHIYSLTFVTEIKHSRLSFFSEAALLCCTIHQCQVVVSCGVAVNWRIQCKVFTFQHDNHNHQYDNSHTYKSFQCTHMIHCPFTIWL